MSSLFSRYSARITDTSGYCGNESFCSLSVWTDERCGIKFREKTRFEIRGSTPKDMRFSLVSIGQLLMHVPDGRWISPDPLAGHPSAQGLQRYKEREGF